MVSGSFPLKQCWLNTQSIFSSCPTARLVFAFCFMAFSLLLTSRLKKEGIDGIIVSSRWASSMGGGCYWKGRRVMLGWCMGWTSCFRWTSCFKGGCLTAPGKEWSCLDAPRLSRYRAVVKHYIVFSLFCCVFNEISGFSWAFSRYINPPHDIRRSPWHIPKQKK